MIAARCTLVSGCLVGMLLSTAIAMGVMQAPPPASPASASPASAAATQSQPPGLTTQTNAPAPAVQSPGPATASLPRAPSAAQPAPSAEPLAEVTVQAKEPRYVAPTTRDRIGRIWAPVMIDGKGPFRLVLDTGANHSAITPGVAQALGSPGADTVTLVTGFTGSAVVPTITVSSMEVGDLLMAPTTLPVVPDVFGGAVGVLGDEGLAGKRIFADFAHDKLVIARSHNEQARPGFTVVHLQVIEGGLLVADARVGGIRCKAIIDTGAQGSIGNLPLRDALMRYPPRHPQRADVEGVTLAVQSGDYLEAPDIEMGGLTIRGVHITFGDMYLFQHWKLTDKPVLLLGMDLLGSFDVLILDYRMQQMQIRLTRAGLPP